MLAFKILKEFSLYYFKYYVRLSIGSMDSPVSVNGQSQVLSEWSWSATKGTLHDHALPINMSISRPSLLAAGSMDRFQSVTGSADLMIRKHGHFESTGCPKQFGINTRHHILDLYINSSLVPALPGG